MLLYGDGLLLLFNREVFGFSQKTGAAVGRKRADRAFGRSGGTDQGTQVHQGFVKISGGVFGHVFFDAGKDFVIGGLIGGRKRKSMKAGIDADGIAVYGRFLFLKGQGRNGTGHIGTDPRHLKKFITGRRKCSVAFLAEIDGAFLKVSCPGIISETFPQL